MRLKSDILEKLDLKSILIGIGAVGGIIAFALPGGPTRFGGGVDPNTAAQVGDVSVPMRDLRRQVEYMSRMLGPNATPEQQQANVQRALDNLIQQAVVQDAATKLGWGARDIEVAYWIRTSGYFTDPETGTFDKNAYRKALRSGRVNEGELSFEAKRAIAISKFSSLLYLPLPVPDKLAGEFAQIQATQFKLEALEIAPSPEAVAKAQKEAVAKFLADAKNEDKLKKSYEERKADFVHPEQVKIRTILVAYKGAEGAPKIERSKDDAKALAGTLLDRLAKGEEFFKVATETNDDPAARAAGGELGWVDKSSVDAETFAAAKTLNAKSTRSQVVETPKGFRIIEWMDARPESNRSLADVREELAGEIVKPEIASELRQKLEDEAEKSMSAGAEAFGKFVAANNLRWTAVEEPVQASSRFVGSLGFSPDLPKYLFDLQKQGDLVPKVLEVGGKKTAFRLVSRTQDSAKVSSDAARDELSNTFQSAYSSAVLASLQKSLSDSGKIVPNPMLQAAPRPE